MWLATWSYGLERNGLLPLQALLGRPDRAFQFVLGLCCLQELP
jgi:hypothetical protein